MSRIVRTIASRRCQARRGRRATATMRPSSRKRSHQPPCPRESNQSEAKRVTTAASTDHHNRSPFVNIHCLPVTFQTSSRSEEHTSELQSLAYLVCRLLLEKKKYTAAVSYILCA